MMSMTRQLAAAQRTVSAAQSLLRALLLVAAEERDGPLCCYCKVPTVVDPIAGERFRERTLDHVIALSQGGKDELDNVVLACRSCNSRKGTRPQYQYAQVGNPMRGSHDD